MTDTEQQLRSPTDQEDLEATLHHQNIPVEQDNQPQEQNFDNVPTEYTESYGTGVQQYPGDSHVETGHSR
ncbi:hypothetical protein PCC7424_4867 [Gloeothece citriformis PCC 7424]|uniref:Uncharacterized protein n=1 Tax=Gloeothece citriformis (strain PCC 7424) TaxID=65393 RepID=B7KEA6_GLOC7|nr:hypothetical protein [Gloeothece citriformis]ACK73224.1 hypothetical protein PCC7424_4867 [Gloeothece citriformis PCC 7424]